MDNLLRDVLRLLHSIQNSCKGSIGAIHNTYLPQLDVNWVDKLATRVEEKITETNLQSKLKYYEETCDRRLKEEPLKCDT